MQWSQCIALRGQAPHPNTLLFSNIVPILHNCLRCTVQAPSCVHHRTLSPHIHMPPVQHATIVTHIRDDVACVCTYTIDTHIACVSCMRQRGHTNNCCSDDRPENNDASSVAMLLLPKFLSKHVRIGGRHNGNQRNESSRHMQCVHSAA